MNALNRVLVLAGMAGMSLALAGQASAAVDTYGLELFLGSGSSIGLNDPGRFWDYRFTPNQTVTVNSVLTKLNAVVGSPNLQVGIQADDGFGNASGVDLAYASWSPGTGVVTSTLNVAITLNSGSTYHFVQRVPNGDANNVAYVADRSPSLLQSHVQDGTPDTSYSARYSSNGGSSWSDYTDTEVWGLYNNSSTDAVGQPYTQTNFRTIGQDVWQGQSFTFTGWGSNTGVDQIAMKVYKGAASAADDLRLHLYDVSTQSDLWSGKILDKNAAITGGAGDVITVSLGGPVTLVSGNKYVLALESFGTTADGTYQLNVNYAVDTPLRGINFQEANGSSYVYAFKDSLPSAFTSGDSSGISQDAYFTLHTVAVPEPASLSLIALGALALYRRRGCRI
ncbi:MAG: PEP-CTERM sorting domain-containing protein [Phycisphaerales bacterium]|nr:PEP-CTERM sorting domain-containing protein [Phycisphaerales bacterium]